MRLRHGQRQQEVARGDSFVPEQGGFYGGGIYNTICLVVYAVPNEPVNICLAPCLTSCSRDGLREAERPSRLERREPRRARCSRDPIEKERRIEPLVPDT